MSSIEAFRNDIIKAGVLDPEGTHHEFVCGMYGRKLDFDIIENDSSLYKQWVDVTASHIEDEFPDLPQVIVGVANGTNRLALDTARKFEGEVVGAVSKKDVHGSKVLWLSDFTANLIHCLKPKLVVVVEDVGTTGSSAAQVATQCRETGAQKVEVVITWKRRQQLEKLEEAENISYRAIIDEPLPTYSVEDL